MEININRYSYNRVLDLLKKMSHQFTPALSDSLNLDEYAEKLANYASFLTYSNNGQIDGAIVFYPNKTTSILYISLVWVEKDYRGRKIAKRMFERLIEYSKNEGFSSIDLEVLKNNITANHLYSSLGFYYADDRREKILMKLKLI